MYVQNIKVEVLYWFYWRYIEMPFETLLILVFLPPNGQIMPLIILYYIEVLVLSCISINIYSIMSKSMLFLKGKVNVFNYIILLVSAKKLRVITSVDVCWETWYGPQEGTPELRYPYIVILQKVRLAYPGGGPGIAPPTLKSVNDWGRERKGSM